MVSCSIVGHFNCTCCRLFFYRFFTFFSGGEARIQRKILSVSSSEGSYADWYDLSRTSLSGTPRQAPFLVSSHSLTCILRESSRFSEEALFAKRKFSCLHHDLPGSIFERGLNDGWQITKRRASFLMPPSLTFSGLPFVRAWADHWFRHTYRQARRLRLGFSHRRSGSSQAGLSRGWTSAQYF